MSVSSRRHLKSTAGKIDLGIGILIGMGGFAELTILGMLIWIIKQSPYCIPYQKKSLWIKDIVIINIGILMLLYWNYIDPNIFSSANQFTNSGRFCPVNALNALTWQEGAKVICTSIFALVCNHTDPTRLRNLIKGIASGFLFYAIPTLIGSIVLQGFRMGGNKIYNIFTHDLSAQSTTIGYLLIMTIAIFIATESRLLYPATAIGFIAGVQASDKGVLLITSLALAYLCGSMLLKKIALGRKSSDLLGWITIGFFILIAFASFRHSSSLQKYLMVALGERSGLYIEGYAKFIRYLFDTSNNTLSDAGISFWWHSVPLDAARAAGLAGAATSLLWLAIIVLSAIVFCKRSDYRLVFLSLVVLFIYMTSLPLNTGAYEFMGLVTGTVLIINELWKNPLRVTLNSQKKFS